MATPSTSLLANLRDQAMRFEPFARMPAAQVERFVGACTQVYFEPDEAIVAPADGPVQALYWIRRGSVGAWRGEARTAADAEYTAGDFFPVGAALGARAVRSTYRATADTFCLRLPVAALHMLTRDCAPLAEFLNGRVEHLLALSQQALQAAHASQVLAEQSLETPLAQLLRRPPVGVAPHTPLGDALRTMHEQRIGSILVTDPASGAALGILTRDDILDRVTLAGVGLDTPIERVMSTPVHTLSTRHSAQDAALAMARHGIRHLPLTDADDPRGRVVGLVSERDLFALQRLSLAQLSGAIRAAADVAALRERADDIRRFARHLVGQGVRARQLTELISRLNDELTERLVVLIAQRRGVDLAGVCWIAFGSEGRSEQTIATDQDNGIVFAGDGAAQAHSARPVLLAFAREVNEALDACGYPLCKGNVMASNPECCLSADEWLERFAHWVAHDAARTPRFLRQLAENALRNAPALSWTGALEAQVDLKLHGTAIYVDAARLFALAQGVQATGTRARFEAAAPALGVPPQETQGWAGAFEYLQMLRLQVQFGSDGSGNPNAVDAASLSDIDRRILKESLKLARRLQQRIELDYLR
jgi:CBS domain-containing protein